jgi:hypothetical protein
MRCILEETLLPILEISGPEGQRFQVELVKDRITIGRFDLFNDVALEPDPQQLISRRVHALIERDTDGFWWVVDNASKNPTFVRRGAEVEMVEGRAVLEEGDSILILGKLEVSEPLYWELTLHDPLRTKPAGFASPVAYLEYNWSKAKLFRIDGTQRQEIRGMRPQEHKLIRYMSQCNRGNGNVPVVCLYEELLQAIWGEKHFRDAADINHLIYELRQKLEPDPRKPQFLETVSGLGYRLVTRPLKAR